MTIRVELRMEHLASETVRFLFVVNNYRDMPAGRGRRTLRWQDTGVVLWPQLGALFQFHVQRLRRQWQPLWDRGRVRVAVYVDHSRRWANLTWLVKPCRFQWSIGHRLLVSIQLCPVLPPPSSSSCTWNLLSAFLSPDLFSRCSLVVLYFCGPAVSTAVPVWQCCHRFFSMCVQASSIFFFLASLGE